MAATLSKPRLSGTPPPAAWREIKVAAARAEQVAAQRGDRERQDHRDAASAEELVYTACSRKPDGDTRWFTAHGSAATTRVAGRGLDAAGDKVFTPSLTGLGQNAHLCSRPHAKCQALLNPRHSATPLAKSVAHSESIRDRGHRQPTTAPVH